MVISAGATQPIDLTGDGTAAGSAHQLPQQQAAGRRKSDQQARAAAASPSSEDILEQRVRSALRRERYPVGPKLAALRRSQEARHVREYYGVEHLKRLLRYECRTDHPARTKHRCKDVHGPGCRDCRTCHFCRQKTTEEKTCCPCEGNRNQPGGAGRGIWCGNCLQLRMGENVREVLRLPYGQWRCPACRGICNCSGPNCQRASRQLDVTEQLAHEAAGMGYKSVAHYLILTALDERGFVGPMVEVGAVSRERQHRQTLHARTAQQQVEDAAAVPGALQTAAALRAQAEERRLAAEQRRQALLAAIAAVLPRVESPDLQSGAGEPGTASTAVFETDGDDDDDADDDVRNTATPLNPGAFNGNTHQRGSRRASRTSEQMQQGHQRHGGAGRHSPAAPAAAAAPGGLLSPRPVLGRASGAGLPLLGVPGYAAAGPSPSPRPPSRSGSPALPELGMLGGTGVLGFANFADSWRERMVSPLPEPAAGAAAGPADVEAGSRPAAPAVAACGGTGSAVARQQHVQQQPCQERRPQQQQPQARAQQQQLSDERAQRQQLSEGRAQQQQQQQQDQQRGQQDTHQQPAADPAQRLRLQRLQAAEEHYGPNDLLGGDAPGYRADTSTRNTSQPHARPLGASISHWGTTGQQPKVSGWLSAATAAGSAAASQRALGSRLAHRLQQVVADPARATAPRASTADMDPLRQEVHTTRRHGAPAHPAASTPVPGSPAVRSAEAVGLDQATPAKRMRTEGTNLPSHSTAAQTAGPAAGAGATPRAHGTQPCAAAAAGEAADQQAMQQHEQQQQPQSRLQRFQPGYDLTDVSEEPDDERLARVTEAEYCDGKVSRYAKSVQQLQKKRVSAGSSHGVDRKAQQVRLASNGLEQMTFADWDSPLVVNRFAETESRRAAAAADVTKLSRGINALLVLAETLPLVDVRFAVVGRLDGSTGAFLDFKCSDPVARATVINAWYRLTATLINRGNPGTALDAANSAAAAVSQQAADKAVQQAIKSSIEMVQAGLECMLELVAILLGWLSVFQAEYEQLHRLQYSPQDLLGPISVGHLRWGSAHTQQQPQAAAGAPAWQLHQQEQMRQEEVRQQRLLELGTLTEADSNMLCSVLTHVSELSRRLPRRVAAALLDGGHLGRILDMNLLWPVEVCTHALTAVKALTAAAAPDLQDASRWFVEDPEHMKQLLAERQQQQQQQQQQLHQQAVPGLQAVALQQLSLFQQVVYSQVQAAQRAAEVAHLAQVAKQHLLLSLEQLVAAEFAARENWVRDNLLPKPAEPQQLQQQQQQLAAAVVLPWYLQTGGAQQVAAVAAGPAQKVTSLQQQEEQEQHSFKLGATKVETLALVYALQLQGGAVSWLQMEKQIVAPASSLNQLLESFQNQQLRNLVIYLAAEIGKHAPSAVQWQQHQQVHQQQPLKQAVLPADWLLRLWVRAMLDAPSRGCRRSAGVLTLAMLQVPATAGLFQSFTDVELQYLIPYVERDQYGHLRARWLCQVAKTLLTGAHSAGGGGGGGGGGGLRCQELRDMLSGLPQVLKARQSELEKCRQHTTVLLWQRSCMPSVLGLTELIADTLATCNCLAPGAAGTSAASASPAPTYLVVSDLKKIITELLGLASSWVRYAVAAVCGRVGGSGSSGELTGTADPSSSEVRHQEAVTLICQASALAELQGYLTILVHLAGAGCKLDDISTDLWPADTSSSSKTLRRVWADVTAAQRAQQQQQRTGGLQQQHGPSTQALSLTCLSELVLAVVQLPSAGDALRPNEQTLFSYIAAALASCSGFSPTGAAAGGPARSADSGAAAAPRIPEGYSSPGLLHLLLGSHIRVLLDASSDRGTAAAHSKAVNVLHLVRAVLQQPGVLDEYGQRLLLPCLARPLLKLLNAATASPAVQYQVYQLLQQLFSSPVGKLLRQPGQSVDTGRSAGWNGCLRSMTPLEPSKLQQMLQLLLTASIRSCLGAVAAPLGPTAAADGESFLRQRLQPQQEEQYLFPLQAADVQALELQLQNNISGSLPVVSTQLSGVLATAEYRATSSRGAVRSGAERPGDYAWILAKAALGYCTSLAKLQSCGQQLSQAAKFMFMLLQRGGLTAAPLHDAFGEFTKQFPQRLSEKWSTRLDALRRQVAQQQQPRMAPPPSRPPHAGQRPAGQAKQPVQQQGRTPQQHQRPPTPPAAANFCSQAGSVAGGGRQQQMQETDSHGGTRIKRPRRQQQQHTQHHGVQQSQTHTQPASQQRPAMSAGQSVCASPAVRPPPAPVGVAGRATVVSATAADEDDDVSSSACGTSSGLQSQPVQQPFKRSSQQKQLPQHQNAALQNQRGSAQQPQEHQQSLQQPHECQQSLQQQQQQQVLQQPTQQPSQQVTPQQPPKKRQQQPADKNYSVFGQLADYGAPGGGQLGLKVRMYWQEQSETYKGVAVVKLSGALAQCALNLLKQGRLTKGMLLGIRDVLHTSRGNVFVPSDTSKLILEPQGGDCSGSVGGKSSATRVPAAGKENTTSACSGDSATANAAPGGNDAPPAGVAATESGRAAAATQPQLSGEGGQLISANVALWRSSLRQYECFKHRYEQQQNSLKASQSQSSGGTKAQPSPGAAALGAPTGAGATGVNQQQDAPRPAASAFQDSQATIKYVTQPTEM